MNGDTGDMGYWKYLPVVVGECEKVYQPDYLRGLGVSVHGLCAVSLSLSRR